MVSPAKAVNLRPLGLTVISKLGLVGSELLIFSVSLGAGQFFK
jgi:hypothetical protein